MENQATRKSLRKPQNKQNPVSTEATCNSNGVNLNAIFEAEEAFLAAPERNRTREGFKIHPGADYSDWYIKPVEDGPWPYKTREEFRQSLDRWEKGIDNEDLVRKQLAKHGVVTLNGEPYDRRAEVIPIETDLYERMMTLIQNYKYEEEPDHEADDDLKKMIPDYKPLPNRFTEFMLRRDKILRPTKPSDAEMELPVGDGKESSVDTLEEIVEAEEPEPEPELELERVVKLTKKRKSSDEDEDYIEKKRKKKSKPRKRRT